MLAGRLDVGPVSLLDYLEHADTLELLPGPAIGSDGPVQSCVLASRVPLTELDGRLVRLSAVSRTTVLLARIYLEDVLGVRPRYTTAGQSERAPHPAGPYPAGPHPTSPRPAGPHPASPYPAGPHPAGPYPAGPHRTSPRPAGPHPTSPHPAGPHWMGQLPTGLHQIAPLPTSLHQITSPPTGLYQIASHPTSPHLTGPHPTSPHQTSPHPTSPHQTSPHLTGPHLTGPHPTGPHPTSPHPTGPHPTGPQPISLHLTGPHQTTGAQPTGPHRTGLDWAGSEPDAFVEIGDDALRLATAPPPGVTIHDLGALWRAWTGLPMVFAVWVARRDFADDRPVALRLVRKSLACALIDALDQLPTVAADAVPLGGGLDEQVLLSYFRTLDYSFGERQQAGLRAFAALAASRDEIQRTLTTAGVSP